MSNGKSKSTFVAALIGLFFGSIGIGIYFKSWTDFFLSSIPLTFFYYVMPGVGILPGNLAAACYGIYRAENPRT